MVDILIYTNPNVLNHKIEDNLDPSLEIFWEFAREPRRRDEVKKIYFATKGKVRGFFKVVNFSNIPVEDIHGRVWDGSIVFMENWHPIENGEEVKPSQGWRYYESGAA
jgi:hypothetical protein